MQSDKSKKLHKMEYEKILPNCLKHSLLHAL